MGLNLKLWPLKKFMNFNMVLPPPMEDDEEIPEHLIEDAMDDLPSLTPKEESKALNTKSFL